MARQALQAAGGLDPAAGGHVHARAAAQRAVRSCQGVHYARAVAELTRRNGRAEPGRTYTHRGLDLRGVGGRYVLDWARTSDRLRSSGSPAARRGALARIDRLSSQVGSERVWTLDPTAPRFHPASQVVVLRALGRTPGAQAARLVGDGSAALRRPATTSYLRSRGEIQALEELVDLLRAVQRSRRHHGIDQRHPAMRRLGASGVRLLRSIDAGGWARLGGRDATPAQQRRLARLAEASVRTGLVPGMREPARRLAMTLRSGPVARYAQLPNGGFYPWPVDGYMDTQSVRISIDKPATVTLRVYSGTVMVFASEQVLGRGPAELAWNGHTSDGERLPAGRYAYGIEAVDPFGNRRHVPGIGSFRILVDTTPPRIRAARAEYRSGRQRRYIRVDWDVVEQHSPVLHVELRIVGNGQRRILPIRGVTEHRSGRMLVTELPRGTYRAYVYVRDGSGNDVQRQIPNIAIP